MIRMLAAVVLVLGAQSTAFAFDAATDGLIGQYKARKPVSKADVVALMNGSERWCYAQEAGSCSWTDVYLEASPETARFEIGSPWSEAIDIGYIDKGAFDAEGRLCETTSDWAASVHAANHADNTVITGRALEAIRVELASRQSDAVLDCFDYLFLSADRDAQTVSLLQRQYSDGTYLPERDVAVTLHFDPASANALTLRW